MRQVTATMAVKWLFDAQLLKTLPLAGWGCWPLKARGKRIKWTFSKMQLQVFMGLTDQKVQQSLVLHQHFKWSRGHWTMNIDTSQWYTLICDWTYGVRTTKYRIFFSPKEVAHHHQYKIIFFVPRRWLTTTTTNTESFLVPRKWLTLWAALE